MLRGERRAYRRGTATGHLSTRHDLTSFHASSSSLQGCPRVKLGGGGGGGERGGEGSLSLDKAKRWTSCQVTRNSGKQESIPSEIHTYTFPTESIQRIRPPRLAFPSPPFRKGGRSSRRKTRFARNIWITQITMASPPNSGREGGGQRPLLLPATLLRGW